MPLLNEHIKNVALLLQTKQMGKFTWKAAVENVVVAVIQQHCLGITSGLSWSPSITDTSSQRQEL